MTKGPSEKDFQRAVIEYAELRGWMVYHVAKVKGQLRSKTGIGFYDLVMVEGERRSKTSILARVVFAECKTQKGKTTPEQDAWLKAGLGSKVWRDVYLWRPSDWPEIERVLR